MATLALALLAPGCAPRSALVPIPADAPAASPVALTVTADWDDLRPALNVALTRCSMAAESIRLFAVPEPADPPRPGEPVAAIDGEDASAFVRLEADLVLIRGVTGRFTAVRMTEGNEGVDIRLTCRIGTAGDPGLEACLVESVAWRLEQLRGVAVAPVRWP